MHLDLATTSMLAGMALNETPDLSTLPPDEARLVFSEINRSMPPGPQNVVSNDLEIPVAGASIRARVLTPSSSAKRLIIYFHGGGWVIGNIDDYDAVGRHLAEACQAAVVMVDYRKAPEHPFPTPVNDCYSALEWIDKNRATVGGDSLPLVIAGDSAGGNLATVVAIRARDQDGPHIDLQALVYPVTDGAMAESSWGDDDKQLFLTSDLMARFWEHYADSASRLDPMASPLRAKSLHNLPPAVVLTAEFDILVDEGQAYVDKLRASGVSVSHKNFLQQMHGFFAMPAALPAAGKAMAWLAQEMDRHLTPTERKDVVVVGAGFSGMYQLHKLREQGLSVQVFERGSDVGGTWYWNRYPGARVDIESMAYSFSFSDDLQQEWQWSEKYSPQPELLKYAQHIADRFDLKSDIAFNTSVASAHFDDDAEEWLVTTQCGRRVRAQHLVMATGVLSASKTPDIAGRESYKGSTYTTGLWPKEGVDFTGKRVAVIGTGSSAVQAIPLIAEEAAEVVVYQRTATFTTPALNHKLAQDDADAIKANYSDYRAKQRLNVLGVVNERSMDRAIDATPEERSRRFTDGWESGILPGMLFQFADLQVEQESNDQISEYIRDRIRTTVNDEQTAQDLLPTDYPYGTKRPCIDTNYYETFNRDNVSLVNLRRTPIETITSAGIKTIEGEREFDAIVYATGFDAMTGPLLRVDIRGRGGVKLQDAWVDGPRSYLGIAIHGFPNLFTITGPSSPSVLSNMLVSIEQHVDWVSDCIQWMRSEGKATIEPTDEAEQEWAEHTEQLANMTLYPKANSWYMGANVPGKPRMFLAYVGGVGTYRMICDQIASSDYRGFAAH